MRRAAVAAALALSLAGCGSAEQQPAAQEQSGATAATVADPCRLVTAEEVAEVVGEKIVATRPADDSCTYETEDAQASSVRIQIDQSDAAGKMDIARRTAGALRDIGGEAAREGGAAGAHLNAMMSESSGSPRLGDEALFGANSQLSVRKGSGYVAVRPPIMRSRTSERPLLSVEERRKMAVAIAEKAVSRLP